MIIPHMAIKRLVILSPAFSLSSHIPPNLVCVASIPVQGAFPHFSHSHINWSEWQEREILPANPLILEDLFAYDRGSQLMRCGHLD